MKITKIIKLIEKRAKGFTYNEIQEEFLIAENKNEKEQKNLLDLACETKEENNTENKNIGAQISNNQIGVIESPPKRKRGRPRKNPNMVVQTNKCGEGQQQQKGMVLVKRKVHTFFVPPDMSAIKMLIDLEGKPDQEKDDVVELASRRRMLLEEIKKELLGEDTYED